MVSKLPTNLRKIENVLKPTDYVWTECDEVISDTKPKEAKSTISIENAKKQLAEAMKDPRKVRLMECMGINPWQVKPTGWTSPTDTECNQLKKVLDAEAKLRR